MGYAKCIKYESGCNMRYIANKNEIRDIDSYTIETIGIPSMVLMERAAMALYYEVIKHVDKKQRILIVVDGGNNGADGIALARILATTGYRCTLYNIGRIAHPSKEFLSQLNIALNMGLKIYERMPKHEYTVIVDGIFGVGLSRDIADKHKKVIDNLNAMPGFKIAIDIPSGIDSTTGKKLGTAFRANTTVTFGLVKLGMLLFDGVKCCGDIIISDIGFPDCAIKANQPKMYSYEYSDLRKLPRRNPNSNKGTYGHVAVIGGSKNMSGAPFLAAKAAYTMGAGLVKVYTVEENRVIIQSALPEAILTTYSDYGEAIACTEDALNWADVIIVGPGLGRDSTSERILYELLLNVEVPIIIDADGLNLIKDMLDLVKNNASKVIMTPHIKEMSRLTDLSVEYIMNNKIDVAKRFVKDYGITLVLKDAKTIVPDKDENAYINVSGNSGMSTGGAGDVLTGIIAGLIAAGRLDNGEAAKLGVYIHGLAGDVAKEEKSEYSVIASDIIDGLSKILGGYGNGTVL